MSSLTQKDVGLAFVFVVMLLKRTLACLGFENDREREREMNEEFFDDRLSRIMDDTLSSILFKMLST